LRIDFRAAKVGKKGGRRFDRLISRSRKEIRQAHLKVKEGDSTSSS